MTQAKVTIIFKDGRTVAARVDDAKGHPNNPMTAADFLTKAEDCVAVAARALSADTAAVLTRTVNRLEDLADITELVSVIV